MKSLKLFCLPLFALSIGLAACGGKDKDPAPGGSAKKVQYKATASAGVQLYSALYGYDQTVTSITSIGGTTWASPVIDVPASARAGTCVVGAVGVNAQSTLKVEMFVNGELVKTGTASGTALSAGTNLVF